MGEEGERTLQRSEKAITETESQSLGERQAVCHQRSGSISGLQIKSESVGVVVTLPGLPYVVLRD